jgi:hypothetical protein
MPVACMSGLAKNCPTMVRTVARIPHEVAVRRRRCRQPHERGGSVWGADISAAILTDNGLPSNRSTTTHSPMKKPPGGCQTARRLACRHRAACM